MTFRVSNVSIRVILFLETFFLDIYFVFLYSLYMKIYIPIRVMQALSDNAKNELFTIFQEPKRYNPPYSIHLVEDDIYIQALPMLTNIVQMFEEQANAERELNHLREVKKSVDAMKQLFK